MNAMTRGSRWPILALLGVSACGKTTAPPDVIVHTVTFANVTGIWDFTSRLVESSSGAVSNDTGSFTLTQTNLAFAGDSRVSTWFDGEPRVYNTEIFSGVVRGDSVFFSEGPKNSSATLCVDTAVISGATSDVLTGRAHCGTSAKTWTARRGVAVASVSIWPPTAFARKGDARTLTALVFNARGERVFGRAVQWASADPGVASVDANGRVTGNATGQTAITVSSGNVSGTSWFTVPVGMYVSSISTGNAASCALDGNGSAYCWGRAAFANVNALFPLPASTTVHLNSLDVGGDFVCGIHTATGAAYCWGHNEQGQLGIGSSSATVALSPAPVAGAIIFWKISVGATHACGIDVDRVLYCWGDNSAGQLGDGTQISRSAPARVQGMDSVYNISAGDTHTCAVRLDSIAYCWGANGAGQLGDNTTVRRLVPTKVAPIAAPYWFDVSASGNSTCGIVETGTGSGIRDTTVSTFPLFAAYCWGSNASGVVGNGSLADSHVPVAVTGSEGFFEISLSHAHVCARRVDDRAYCWGENAAGQLGTGTTTMSRVPVAVNGGMKVRSIQTGWDSFATGIDQRLKWRIYVRG